MLIYGNLNMEILHEVLYFDLFDSMAVFGTIISLILNIVFNKSNLTSMSTIIYSIVSVTVALSQLGEPAHDLYFGNLLFLILALLLAFFTVNIDYYVEKKVLGEEANWANSFFVIFIQQLVSEESFISFFICLESMSFCIFLLMGSYIREKSVEATIKYLILSSISTSIILLSSLLLYFYAGTFVMYDVAFDICFESNLEYSDFIVILLILGLTSKLSIYPSNTIAADIGESVLSYIFLLINIMLKFAAFVIILEMQDWINHDLEVLDLINLASYIYGSLSALIETQIIRFLALGATNQFGFLTMCSSGENDLLIAIIVLQLLVYFAAVYRMVNVLEILQKFAIVTNITDLYHVNSNSFLKWYLITVVYDLAGFPPFNIFFTKFILLYFVFTFSSLFIFFSLIIINCIYYFYYLRLLKNILYNKNYSYVSIKVTSDQATLLDAEQNIMYTIVYMFIFLI